MSGWLSVSLRRTSPSASSTLDWALTLLTCRSIPPLLTKTWVLPSSPFITSLPSSYTLTLLEWCRLFSVRLPRRVLKLLWSE